MSRCPPSAIIKGFLEEAEDGLALHARAARARIRADRKEASAARFSRLQSSEDFAGASEQLELQARTMLGLDRRLRGFDARFRSLEKAVTSAAELAAASARCGQDGAEAATAAAAAVRVEAEARCRELAKRIDGILEKDLEAQVDSIVQKCLGKDFQSVQRRLSQLEKLSKEMEESGPKIAAHEATRTHEERGALERRLCAAELAVEETAGGKCLGLASSVGKPLEERMSKLEAEIARLRAPERVAVMQDPAARTGPMHASGDGKGLEQERLTLVIPDFDECRSTSPAPSAASSPSPSKLRAVPFQQQRRPSRSAPGARPEAPVAIVTPDEECQVAVRRESRASSAQGQGHHVAHGSHGSSSPTLSSGSANLSGLLSEHSEGGSSGSHTPFVVQAPQDVGSTREEELDEPVCAFSTNVSELEGFQSGDELILPE